jgi:hypothetical protein
MSRNETKYIVRYRYTPPNPRQLTTRRTWDFNTKDKQQAYRRARKYAQVGILIGLFRHVGNGVWEQLDVPGAESQKGGA